MATSSAQPILRVSPEQYLELDRAAEVRSEYHDGCMYAMVGASFAHNLIAANITRELGQALRKRACYVITADGRTRVSEMTYTYPDVVTISGEPKFADDRSDIVLNPTLIIEVLSPSTEAYDRGYKFALYRQIDSLREYVLVCQTEARIERFEREGGRWVLSEHVGLEAICRFSSVDCEVAMADIYDKVVFAPQTPPLDSRLGTQGEQVL